MGQSRRKYSREFKLEAVKQVVENDRSMASVARGLGVSPALVARWKTEFEESGELAFPGNGKVNAAEEELRQLRRDLSTERHESDILKKTLACFAKEKS